MEERQLLQDIDIIKNEEDFLKLKTAWEKLFSQDNKRVFLSHEWFRHVIKCQPNINLFLLIAKENDLAKAIAPLCITKEIFKITFLRLPVHAIKFILNPFSTFCDFISAKSDKESIHKFIQEVFKCKKWDIALFSRIPQDSATLPTLKEVLFSQHRRFIIRTSSYCPFVKSSDNWDAYLSSQSHNYKEMVRKLKKKIERLDKSHVEFYQRLDDVRKFYADLIYICNNSKKRKDKEFFSRNIERQRFLFDLVNTANDNGWLRAWIVRSGERPIAAEINLFCGNVLHCVFKAHDENYDAYSVGSYLTYCILKYCIDSGYEYDFGPGDLGYKLIWTKDIKKTYEFVIFNKRFFSMVLYYLYIFKETIKKRIVKENIPVSIYGQKPK